MTMKLEPLDEAMVKEDATHTMTDCSDSSDLCVPSSSSPSDAVQLFMLTEVSTAFDTPVDGCRVLEISAMACEDEARAELAENRTRQTNPCLKTYQTFNLQASCMPPEVAMGEQLDHDSQISCRNSPGAQEPFQHCTGCELAARNTKELVACNNAARYNLQVFNSVSRSFNMNLFNGIHTFDVFVQDEKVAAKLGALSVGSNVPLILLNAKAALRNKGLSISLRGITGSPAVNELCLRRGSLQDCRFSGNVEGVAFSQWRADETRLQKGTARKIATLENKLNEANSKTKTLQHELDCKSAQINCLVAELDEFKRKFARQSQDLRQCYNQVLELKGNIRVFCRSRPLTEKEVKAGRLSVLEFDAAHENELIVHANGGIKKTFEFDRVYTPSNTQVDVFADVAPMVISVLDGYNVCIFAYGQTGTGKTFTMEGTEANRGVTYRTLENLFHVITERKGQHKYDISVSVLEVYNEQIRDLLAAPAVSGQNAKKLEIRQNGDGVHYVPGVTEASVNCIDDVWNVLHKGTSARAVGSTNANEHSSRSHCMLCVMVKGESLMTGECIKSKLWLVDLAGSERIAKTDVQGERLKEAQSINKSLSALGDVIQALTSRNGHVPYRNSKLTHLLQDSLSGQSKTLMFVQVSPSDQDLGETLCSLNFASRARSVELGVARKQFDPTELLKYKKLIEKSKQEVRLKDDCIKELQDALKVKEQLCKALSAKVKQHDELIAIERKARSISESKQREQLALIEKQKVTIENLKKGLKPGDSAGQRPGQATLSFDCHTSQGLKNCKRQPLRDNLMDNRGKVAMDNAERRKKRLTQVWQQKENINALQGPDNTNFPAIYQAKRPGRASICIMPSRRASMAPFAPSPVMESKKSDVEEVTRAENTAHDDNLQPSRVLPKRPGRASMCIMPQRIAAGENIITDDFLPYRITTKRPGRASLCVMPNKKPFTAAAVVPSPVGINPSSEMIEPYREENLQAATPLRSNSMLLQTPVSRSRSGAICFRSPHLQALQDAEKRTYNMMMDEGDGLGHHGVVLPQARRVGSIAPATASKRPPQHPPPHPHQFAVDRGQQQQQQHLQCQKKRVLSGEGMDEENQRLRKMTRLSFSSSTPSWGKPPSAFAWPPAPPPLLTPCAAAIVPPPNFQGAVAGGAQRVLWTDVRSTKQKGNHRGWNR